MKSWNLNAHLLLLQALLIICSSCKKNEINNADPNNSNLTTQTIVHNGINRQYLQYVPSSYDGTSSTPLMLNFHGYGDVASNFINDADMRALAESDTFILAYPQGSYLEGVPHWNPCPIDADNKSTTDDLGFVEALVNEISSQYAINSQRIYAAGYSNGGMMAYGLSHHKSDLFAAVASVSGVMLDCEGPPSHPMPIVHLHGTSDGVIPYYGDSFYKSAQYVVDYWVGFNNTSTNAAVNSDNSGGLTIEHYTYSQGDSMVSVEHYKYIGGNHVWFERTYQNKDASQLVWDFVSRYNINGLN